VTPEEVKITIFSLNGSKAGPDGCSAEFLKKAWSTVGEDVI